MTFDDAAARQSGIDRHIAALAMAQHKQLDAALGAIQPGQRLCLHTARLGARLGRGDDDYMMSIRQEYHVLAADQRCEEPNRTEYRRD